MIAGTLARLADPVDEPLESWIRTGDSFPAIEIDVTQETVADLTAQSGTVAGRIEAKRKNVFTGDDHGSVYVDVDREHVVEEVATDFYADVTDTGILLAESIAEDSELPFPFDVLGARAGRDVSRLQVDIETLHDDWARGGALEVWMAGSDERGATMAYHGSASDVEPTIGLGFKKNWRGTTMRGVVYKGGYTALYSARHPADGLRFVGEELLDYASPWVPEEHEDQTDFGDFQGGGD